MSSSDECSDISSEESGSPDQKSFLAKLGRNLKLLYVDNSLADFKVIVGENVFNVHRVVLFLNSPVFRAMLESHTVESRSGVLRIEDFGLDAVNKFVLFMYTGKAPNTEHITQELLKIAEKYDVVILKRRCQKALMLNITTENAIELFVLANRNNCEKLEPAVLSYIKKNYRDVRASQAWAAFAAEHNDLLNKITDKLGHYTPPKRLNVKHPSPSKKPRVEE